MSDLRLNQYDLKISGGDFVIGDTYKQEMDLILRTKPGEWKNAPLVGADVEASLLDENFYTLKRRIQNQLKYDGKELRKFQVKDGKISIDA